MTRYQAALLLAAVLVLSACAGGPRNRKPKAPPRRPPVTTPIPPPTAPAETAAPATTRYTPPLANDTGSGGEFPRTAEEGSGPAVLSLIRQAETEREAKRPEQALAALERALRIEPRNPFVWQALAALHVDQQRSELAESTAQKSTSLARGNPFVEAENWRLIAAARTQRGDAAGARIAEDRADDLD